jgi:SAM-dependent methyltransferase
MDAGPGKDVLQRKVIDFYTNYFSAMLKAFPEVLHLHFGISTKGRGGLFGLPKRLIKGSELLVDEIVSFSRLDRAGTLLRGLDLGCGLAGTSIYLAKRFSHNMIGITIAPSQVPIARKNARRFGLDEKIRIVCGDGTALSFSEATFDFVIMIEVAFHIEQKALLFSEIHRTLRPGGHLVIADIEASSHHPLMSCFGVHSFPPVDAYRLLTAAAGFGDYREKDVSPEVALWMNDYIRSSSGFFQLLVLVSLVLRLRLLSAYSYRVSHSYLRKFLRQNMVQSGMERKDVFEFSSIKRIRSEYKRFLEHKSLIYKFMVQTRM